MYLQKIFQMLLVLVFAFSCSVDSNSKKLSANNVTGGGSDGGGNTYNGKPLESYAKNPLDLESYQSKIAPLISDLEKKGEDSSDLKVLKNLMKSVLIQKIWYFVPGPLEKVPEDLLNSAIRTDQAALQGFDRVWVDSTIWNKMSVEDQGQLMLHEIFMGLKILNFGSEKRLCLAAYEDAKQCADDLNIDGKIALKSNDYVEVQKATIQVSNEYLDLDELAWKKLLNQYEFDFAYDWFELYETVTPADLSDLLKKSFLSGYIPKYGYNLRDIDSYNFTTFEQAYPFIQNNKEPCQVDIKVLDQKIHFKLNSKTESFDETYDLKPQIQSRRLDLFNQHKKLKQLDVSFVSQKKTTTGGYSHYNMRLGFDSFNLSSVYIQEMVCENANCDGGADLDLKGGLFYVCSDSPDLYKP